MEMTGEINVLLFILYWVGRLQPCFWWVWPLQGADAKAMLNSMCLHEKEDPDHRRNWKTKVQQCWNINQQLGQTKIVRRQHISTASKMIEVS
jgi:hypothetical protein